MKGLMKWLLVWLLGIAAIILVSFAVSWPWRGDMVDGSRRKCDEYFTVYIGHNPDLPYIWQHQYCHPHSIKVFKDKKDYDAAMKELCNWLK